VNKKEKKKKNENLLIYFEELQERKIKYVNVNAY
jgi:hypothetical protein